jgi:hypothetical protein
MSTETASYLIVGLIIGIVLVLVAAVNAFKKTHVYTTRTSEVRSSSGPWIYGTIGALLIAFCLSALASLLN